jgi:cell division septum initiation protein DivIVA
MSSHDEFASIADSETILRRVIDLIATARTVPFSSSPMVNRDEVIAELDEVLSRLPDELRQARWMLKERQEFIAKTRREAEDILDAARAQAERMVQRTEVVRSAELRARQIVEAAEGESRKMRLATEDFVDQRLASFEIVLDRVAKTVAAGRQRLNAGVTSQLPEPVEDPDPPTPFFDQDVD